MIRMTRCKAMAVGIGFNGAETNCGIQCTHFRHPTDEQLQHRYIF